MDEKEGPGVEQKYNEMRDFVGKLKFVSGAEDLYDKTGNQSDSDDQQAVIDDIGHFLEGVDDQVWGDQGTFQRGRDDVGYFAGVHGENFMDDIRKAYGAGTTTPRGRSEDRRFLTPERGGAPAFMPDTPLGIRSPRQGRSPVRSPKGKVKLRGRFRGTKSPSAETKLRSRFGKRKSPLRAGGPRAPPARPVFATRPDYRKAYQSRATIMPTIPFPSGMVNVDKYLRNLSRIGASRTPRREWVPLPRQLYVQPSAIRARMKAINHDMQSIWSELRKPVSRPQPQYGTEAQALAR